MEARDDNTKKNNETIEKYDVLHKWYFRLATPIFWQYYFLRICSYYRTGFYIYRGLLQYIFDLSKQSDCELGKKLNIQKKRVLIFNFKGSLLEKNAVIYLVKSCYLLCSFFSLCTCNHATNYQHLHGIFGTKLFHKIWVSLSAFFIILKELEAVHCNIGRDYIG